MRLGTFVVGPENELAEEAFRSLLGDVQTPYSPVVLYGSAGLGKSHLARGLAEVLRPSLGRRGVIDVPATDFARELADAIQTKTTHDFTSRYRTASLVVLDDLDHLAGKPAAQKELVFALDALSDSQSRVVLTSRCMPERLTSFAPRLRSRLTTGLAVPLAPPGLKARIEILRQLADLFEATIADSVVYLLAEALPTVVPHLHRAVRDLHLATGGRIDVEVAHSYLAESSEAREPSLHDIALTTARYFSLRLADLRSPSRRRTVVAARGVAMYLARKLTQESLGGIGHYFGGRDHTTVSHGCRKTEERVDAEPGIRVAVFELHERLASR